MGLDMYAYKATSLEDEDPEQIMYWRKHNALHSWMEGQYTGSDSFNMIKVNLTKDILLKLKEDILHNNLKAKSGFFFGDTDYMDEYENSDMQKEDLQFIENALNILETENNTVVYYDSWW